MIPDCRRRCFPQTAMVHSPAMNEHEHGSDRTRPMSAGAFNFTVEVSHADDLATVESFFRDLPNPPHGAPCELIELIRSDAQNEDGEQQ